MHTNKPLSRDKKVLILALLTEGTGIKTIMRTTKTGAHQVLRLLLDAGETARAYHDLHARNLACPFVEVDELWSYVGEHEYRKTPDYNIRKDGWTGHCWLFSATCADSKFVVGWTNQPNREQLAAEAIFDQIFTRVPGEFQLTSDKWGCFLTEMRRRKCDRMSSGWEMKRFGSATDDHSKSVVNVLLGVERGKVTGNPDVKRITTAHQGRRHLAFRTTMKRFNRRTLGYSKSFPHHDASCALNMHAHNWMKRSEAAKIKGKTPAMALGLASEPMSLEAFVILIEEHIAKREERKWEAAFTDASTSGNLYAKRQPVRKTPPPFSQHPLRGIAKELCNTAARKWEERLDGTGSDAEKP